MAVFICLLYLQSPSNNGFEFVPLVECFNLLFCDCKLKKKCLSIFFSGNKQFCSWDVASYSLGSTTDGYSILQSSVRRERNSDVFCIQFQNGKSFQGKIL